MIVNWDEEKTNGLKKKEKYPNHKLLVVEIDIFYDCLKWNMIF